MADLRIERVVVTGGQRFTDRGRIAADLRALLPLGLQRVAHGAAKGADGLVDLEWLALRGAVNNATGDRWSMESYPADWTRFGNSAGPRRNIAMLEREKPELVLAYPDERSRGTWHCVKQAQKRGIVVAVWSSWIKTLRVGDFETFDDEPRFILHPRGTLIDVQHLAEVLRG